MADQSGWTGSGSPGAPGGTGGWWLASDGNWYPPETHPSRRAVAPAPVEPVTTPGADWGPAPAAAWAAPPHHPVVTMPFPQGTFRTRAVVAAGVADAAIGCAALAAGALVAAGHGSRALPLGLAVALVGMLIAGTGVAHLTARLEVGTDTVAWTWNFSRTERPLTDFVDAALVEKGQLASGAAIAGLLGGGIAAVVAWWLAELFWAFATAGPTRGAYVLTLINVHGGRVQVPAIGTWTEPPAKGASVALFAARSAVTSPTNLARQHLGPVARARIGDQLHPTWAPHDYSTWAPDENPA